MSIGSLAVDQAELMGRKERNPSHWKGNWPVVGVPTAAVVTKKMSSGKLDPNQIDIFPSEHWTAGGNQRTVATN